MLKFIYLVQGQAKLIKRYLHLKERSQCAVYFLTYDEPMDGAIFFPDSTWAQGRNKLLEVAQSEHSEFEYIIYADDDVEFYHGSWGEFEQGLLDYRPKVAVPVFDRTDMTVLPYPLFKVQRFTYNDEQLMAFRKDVIEEAKVLPYQTKFDELHWWATCRLQQILIQNYYADAILQFNFVRVSNLEHDRYSFSDNSETSYVPAVLDWVREKHSHRFKDICKTPHKLSLLFRTLVSLKKLKHPILQFSLAHLSKTLVSLSFWTKRLPQNSISSIGKQSGKWIIYGYGEVGQDIVKRLKQNGLSSEDFLIVDRVVKNGTAQINGERVISPDEIEWQESSKVLIASYSFVKQIEFFLKFNLGFSAKQIYRLTKS